MNTDVRSKLAGAPRAPLQEDFQLICVVVFTLLTDRLVKGDFVVSASFGLGCNFLWASQHYRGTWSHLTVQSVRGHRGSNRELIVPREVVCLKINYY